jgi:hypothetical protein
VGDIWPYGGPKYSNWDSCNNEMLGLGENKQVAGTMAAIAEAESRFDWMVVNDTPSTGDYSVGLWQINYYGGLYSGRVAAYGTPEALAKGGLPKQAKAAQSILRSQGFGAWSTYNNGAYKAYLNGVTAPPPDTGLGHEGLPPHDITPPTADYSDTINKSNAVQLTAAGHFIEFADRIRKIKGPY